MTTTSAAISVSRLVTDTIEIVHLPSFTGRALELDAFASALSPRTFISLQLPEEGSQDFTSLANALIAHLPKRPFVLVAESFSSPIALLLANKIPDIIGLVFVSGFLSLPKQSPYPLIKYKTLPKKIGAYWHQWRLDRSLFNGLSLEPRSQLKSAIIAMPLTLYQARAAAVKSLPLPDESISQPCLVLQGSADVLVDNPIVNDLSKLSEAMSIHTLPSSHYLLNSHFSQAAILIQQFIDQLNQPFSR